MKIRLKWYTRDGKEDQCVVDLPVLPPRDMGIYLKSGHCMRTEFTKFVEGSASSNKSMCTAGVFEIEIACCCWRFPGEKED